MTNFMDLDDNMEEDVWDRCFTVNVKSHLWLMHAAKKYLKESEGCFVSTASGEYLVLDDLRIGEKRRLMIRS